MIPTIKAFSVPLAKTEDGEDDKKGRVDPPNQPKPPDLKPHVPKPKGK